MQQQVDTVFIVDDDAAVRDSLCLLLKTVGLEAKAFESGNAFLEAYDPSWAGCILLDIRMPGISGMEVQKRLIELGCSLPILFVTGHGDVSMAVQAMHLGASDFIEKPYHDQDLLDRLHQALARQQEQQDQSAKKQAAQKRFDTLTPREAEVMGYVVKGAANKVIALDLDVSQRTVEIHRARVMEKMGARSLAKLVRMALLIES